MTVQAQLESYLGEFRRRLRALIIARGTAVLSIAAIVLTYRAADPAPPTKLTLGAGSELGAYNAYGERYRAILARNDIEKPLPRGMMQRFKDAREQLLAAGESVGQARSWEDEAELTNLRSELDAAEADLHDYLARPLWYRNELAEGRALPSGIGYFSM